ncbi:NADH-quinone oxidoreductase subunit L [Paenibacillus sp. GXUN7292]|uniref:NADH-quinone oxidoreductase subunit L n=1 Tax=Paenibacillus sp. GXUN7292 TaxID=3422499 RepID=UPI003D7E70D6
MTETYSQSAWLIPLFPLVAFLALMALGKNNRAAGVLVGTTASLLSFLLSLLVLVERLKPNATEYSYDISWLSVGQYSLRIGFEVTNFIAMMLVMVSLVSLLVHIYSAAYMKRDERITVFYSYLSLFVFAMLGLVLSDNLLTLYIFWEIVGVSSFLLIGFWFARPAAKAAAKKAFIVTRVGDVGLLLAILLLFWYMPDHSLSFTMLQSVFEGQTGTITTSVATAAALLIFLGAIGKSGQFPLHIWLPDAMEGPTPISALIHAATMVAAGVFLVARTFDIFEASAIAMQTVAYVGGFTMLFAAAVALGQKDLKRILAYSTISQLGLMMMALGLGALTSGVFHLLTHAFFKALLFLGAGCIIQYAGTGNIFEMGGLGRKMRLTAWAFAAGALALSGIPPFSGFWSKDAIMAEAWQREPLLFFAGIIAAMLTALYMTRLFVMVFMGEEAAGLRHDDPAKPSGAMTIPLVVLAAITLAIGFVETPWKGWLGEWLSLGDSAAAHGGGAFPYIAFLSSILAGLAGIYLGIKMYGGKKTAPTSPFGRVLENGLYINEFYQYVIVKPYRGVGNALLLFDKGIIGGIVQLFGSFAHAAARWISALQRGQVQAYVLTGLIGAIIIAVIMIGKGLLS